MRMVPKDPSIEKANADAIQVTFEDQKRINTFARLNQRVARDEERLTELVPHAEGCQDALNELETQALEAEILGSDEEDELEEENKGSQLKASQVPVRVGQVFILMPVTEAVQSVERERDGAQKERDLIQSRVTETQRQMAQLKSSLYEKFGNAIQLERS